MKVEVHKSSPDYGSYRAARVKSLFNCDDANHFDLAVDLDLPETWSVGAIVGPSGSGKSSLGEKLWGGGAVYQPDWEPGKPIVDLIAPDGDFNAVTGSLASVGLGEVRAWLRPYEALSTGQKFRADLARLVSEAPKIAVVDEFTSVVDRQIAKVGAQAFGKAWRRTGGQVVVLSCHYDMLEWLSPDWVLDTADGGRFTKEWKQPRPRLEVEIRRGGWELWPWFKPYHYLDVGPMPAAKAYVAFIGGNPVAHLGMGTKNRGRSVEARGCRLVVLPEWQGAGVGMRMLNAVSEEQRQGRGVLPRRMTTIFHTSHPQLCVALRRDPNWRQVSAAMYGGNRGKSRASMRSSGTAVPVGYGGHLRAVQGFRYYGRPGG